MPDSSDKTEKPTPKRLREAREKGQIARSPDLAAWAGMCAAVVLLQFTIKRGAVILTDVFNQAAVAMAHPDDATARHFAAGSLLKALSVIAPMVLGMMT